MEPTKEDRHGKEGKVRRISNKMTEILAELAHRHPYEESVDGKLSLSSSPGLGRFPQKPDEGSITKQCWR